MILEELNNNKNNEISFKKSLGTVITKGAEVASIVSAAIALLSLWRIKGNLNEWAIRTD